MSPLLFGFFLLGVLSDFLLGPLRVHDVEDDRPRVPMSKAKFCLEPGEKLAMLGETLLSCSC